MFTSFFQGARNRNDRPFPSALRSIFVTGSLLASFADVAHAALPAGWTDTDIGAPGVAGSASVANGVWTVAGSGSDIWNNADQFNFVSTPFMADGAIIAKVGSLTDTDPWAKAGVMFRNDSTAGSMNAMIVVSEGNGVNFQWRTATSGVSTSANLAGAAPLWVEMVRSGDNFSGYYSTDGTNWIQVGSTETLTINGPILAGLCVTAHNNSALNTSTFSNVTLTSQSLGVYRQLWTNLNASVGNTLAALTNTTDNPNWPNNPAASFTHVFTNFQTETSTGMNYYGQRVRAFVVPPVTGSYTFWISSDDSSQLLLGKNENSNSAVQIATVPVNDYTSVDQWNKYPNQQSAPILLQGGYRYYLEADMEQGNGGDNLGVGWQLPNGTLEQPMSALSAAGTILIPYNGTNTLPGILAQSSNTTVVENQSVALSVLASNQAPMTYKWYINGAASTVTNPVYVLTNASYIANNGQTYTCLVSNALGSAASSPIILTVSADTVPPAVTNIFNIGTNLLDIVYSKPVTAATANAVTNYAFSNGLVISNSVLASDNVTVTLTVAPLTYQSNYSVIINGILDTAHVPVMIATNTVASFTASQFIPATIGSPSIPSSVTVTSNGLNVTAGGAIGGSQDQASFQYQQITGNFDVSVCLSGLGLSSLWAEAGLMARANLAVGSPFAASIATPGIVGAFFESRTTTNGTATSAGSFPVNFPNTWLRLNRVGSIFNGYASYDGTNWTQTGSVTIAMPAAIYLGMTAASGSTNQSTLASFVNYSNTSPSAVVATVVNPHEPLGPSSRLTPIAFSEIMWKPAPNANSNDCEYIELYNSEPWFHDVSGYQVTCADMNYTFPPNTVIPGGGFLVIAASPSSIQNVYGITNVMGPYTGSLKHSETLELLDEVSNVLLTVPYTDVYPWPVATDATGHSLVLAYPSYGEGDPRAWDISDIAGGSPGTMESYRPSPLRNVVINEILPHSENSSVQQFIELYNHSTNSVDVSGCILTGDPSTNEFVIPSGSVIPPHGFISFNQSQFGFTLNGAGQTVYFIKPDGSRVLDAVQFGPQADGVSYGRWPDGANDFYAFTNNTPGTNNSTIVIGDVVINELMYDPISNDDYQYIELYNKGTNTINLAGWQFTAGVTYTFPSGAVIAPNGYVVVGKNIANLFASYTNLSSANTFGNFSGKLSHHGELVTLSQPESYFGTNTILVEEDEVSYGTGGRWGQWSGGSGSSLELIDPHSNHRLAANWADSDETHKSSWVDIETTGVLDNGANFDPSIQHAQIGLLDTGEALVDNIEVDFNGTNLVTNSNFDSGLGNWTLQGDHSRSSLDSPGYNSSYALHLRASDHMWNGVNSCQASLNANPMTNGSIATLRFKARWLRGWPEAMLRLNGNWLQAYGQLPVPSNLGTPGAPNSALVANAGPAIYHVSNSPTIPIAGQPVVVTARVHDPDGVQSVTLVYRIDPSTSYTAVAMNDSGVSGDAIAGDGIFSATIPAQASGTIVAFYLTALDKNGNNSRFPAVQVANAPVPECVIGFGDGGSLGAFASYHCWITSTNSQRWQNLADLSNEGIDFTFANNSRVIYNAQGHFTGSPYHQDFDTPTGSLCHYKWIFPDDDQFLGTTDFNKIHQPGNGAGDDASLQREQIANTFLRTLKVPWLNRHYVAVYFNGNLRGGALMEDAQVPGSDMVKEHYPNDSDGFLFKMQPWFEFAPSPSGSTIGFNNNQWCVLEPFTTTGGALKLAPYRYNFEMRRSPGSESDYNDVFDLIQAANSTSPNFTANMKNLVNMENWMRVFAANHAAGNWDSFGAQNAQNLYGYIGTEGTKYSLLMWDFNIVLGNSSSWGPGQNLFTTTGGDTNMAAIYNDPEFLRMYWRAMQELVNGPLANSAPLANAKYTAFYNSGLTGVENPTSAILPWLSQAQSSIASQLAAVNASAFSVSPTVVISNNVAYVSGGAPVLVDTISINGTNYPLTWTTLTNWTVAIPIRNGTNSLAVTGNDKNGNPVSGATGNVQAVLKTTPASPVGSIVVNEIMYDPAITNSQFVEFYNNSTNTEFDLSGWQVSPLSYTFPSGSTIAPNSFLVLAANAPFYASVYGGAHAPFDIFSGELPTNGETTLALLQPQNGTNTPVVQVRYSDQLPWPTNASGTGASLQLIDARQDDWRTGNWAVSPTNSTPNATNKIAAKLPAFPPLWINEVEPDELVGITNSAGEHVPWIELYNPSSSNVSLAGLCLSTNYASLTNWIFPAGASINANSFEVIFADGRTNLSTLSQLHTSFTLSPVSGSLALSRIYNGAPQVLDYLDYSQMAPDYSYGSFPDGQSFDRQVFYDPTPGASNNGTALPPPSFIPYLAAGSTYSQNFDSLPDPGATSVNSANPVTISGVTYSLSNPFDFAYPPSSTGNNGGLGIPAMEGWYGLSDPSASIGTRFGATDGDQTTGGDISFGLPSSSNRALGLLATSTTGYTAFGAKFINGTGETLNSISLQFTAEVWRQSNLGKTLEVYYYIDPSGTNNFSTAATGTLPTLNVNFPTVSGDVGGAAVDGTAPANQAVLSVTNQSITSWPPSAALWVVWEMASAAGKSQGLGIDNLSFSATESVPVTPVPVTVQLSGTNFILSWPSTNGLAYQIQYTTNLANPTWVSVTAPSNGTGASVSFTNAPGASTQGFYRLVILPQ